MKGPLRSGFLGLRLACLFATISFVGAYANEASLLDLVRLKGGVAEFKVGRKCRSCPRGAFARRPVAGA